jgi:hypothetical protein
MSQQPSAWGKPIKDWGRYLKSVDAYIRSVGESTVRFGDEESLRCHACGTWVEPTLARLSRYDGEPLCAGCAEAEGIDD